MVERTTSLIPAFNIIGSITQALITSAMKSYQDKKTYEDKLENAKGPDIFKYVLLINISALDGYVAQARLQAQQSFALSKLVAITGFVIIVTAICLSVFLTITGNQNLNAAYLTAIAGILTEFTSGVFFFLYSKTLNQINLFHDKLVEMQKTALSHLTNEQVEVEFDDKVFSDQWHSRFVRTAEAAKKFINDESTKKLYEAYKKNQTNPEGNS